MCAAHRRGFHSGNFIAHSQGFPTAASASLTSSDINVCTAQDLALCLPGQFPWYDAVDHNEVLLRWQLRGFAASSLTALLPLMHAAL
jgi:hypothetical protein